MTTAALVFSALLILLHALIRAAGSSLIRTPRADALHDSRNGDERAEKIASLLAERPKIEQAMLKEAFKQVKHFQAKLKCDIMGGPGLDFGCQVQF